MTTYPSFSVYATHPLGTSTYIKRRATDPNTFLPALYCRISDQFPQGLNIPPSLEGV